MKTSDLLSATQYAALHGIDPGNLRRWLAQGRVAGAFKIGRQWVIPADAPPPQDLRVKTGKYIGFRKKE